MLLLEFLYIRRGHLRTSQTCPENVAWRLQASHRAIKHLGRGAAADTWLFVDRKRNRLVAIKLFPRPIPAGLRDSTLSEIKVALLGAALQVFLCPLHDSHALPCARSQSTWQLPDNVQTWRWLVTLQCQMELGPGHINLINVYEAILTPDHLGIVMEYAAGGALTAHVAERWGAAKPGGLILTEDEGRFFFRVSQLQHLVGQE